MNTLSIIILQHNSPKETENCLRSLQKTWLPEKTDVVVVNNGGHDANQKISKDAYENLTISFFDIQNHGYPQGNNFGLKQSRGSFVAFINPDIVVQEDTIKKLFTYLEDHHSVGIVAPRLVYADSTIQDNYRVFPRFIDLVIKRTPFLRRLFPQRMRQYLMWDKEPMVSEAVDWVTGAFQIVRRNCLDAIGKHDQRYFLFMSDVSLCREAWNKDFEVHFVGDAQALHNDERLSSGGFLTLFKKKTLRIHVKDAFTYYLHYFGKSLPEKSPSISHIEKKDRLLQAKLVSGTATVSKLKGKLQRQNPVVTVYRGHIVGHKNYEQPIIFFDTGVVAVIRDKKGQFGLMSVWRHIPLSFTKKNTFPIFPDVGELGMWSYECPRGGIEKSDRCPEEALKREVEEEIGLKASEILSINYLGNIIGNTAIDIYHHKCFEITVSDTFQFSTDERVETIKEFNFFQREEIAELIKEKKLFCAITQAALLQGYQ